MSILEAIPEHWGYRFESAGAAIADAQIDPASIHLKTKAYFFLIMLCAQPERTLAINSDRRLTGFAPTGNIEIVPQDSELFSTWRYTKHTMLIAMTEKRLLQLSGHEWGEDPGEFHLPRLGVVDEKALAIATEMRNELVCASFGYEECLESLLTLFGIHVLRTYTNLNKRSTYDMPITGGLSPMVRSRVIDYIHTHLAEKITIETLASIAGLSPSHFARAFRQSLGQTPHEFVVTTRLQLAKKMIQTSSTSLYEISQLTGFSSNSHMSASMKKAWGKNPSQIRHSERKTLQARYTLPNLPTKS